MLVYAVAVANADAEFFFGAMMLAHGKAFPIPVSFLYKKSTTFLEIIFSKGGNLVIFDNKLHFQIPIEIFKLTLHK